jgi:hypothetical protein
MEGQAYTGAHDAASLQMTRDCLGAPLTEAAVRGEGVDLRPADPHPLDLVLFRGTRSECAGGADGSARETGVVVETAGPRVRFMVLSQGRVRLGVLNLVQPNRRRLQGATIENSYLRVACPGDGASTRYLAGQLLAGFFTPRAE